MASEELKNTTNDYKDEEETLSSLAHGNFAEAFSGMNLASAIASLYSTKVAFRTGNLRITSSAGTPNEDFFTFMTTTDAVNEAYKHHEALLKILRGANFPKESVEQYINNTMLPTYENWPSFSNEQRAAFITGLQDAFKNVFPTIH